MGGRSILSNWIVCQNMVLVWLAIDDFFLEMVKNILLSHPLWTKMIIYFPRLLYEA